MVFKSWFGRKSSTELAPPTSAKQPSSHEPGARQPAETPLQLSATGQPAPRLALAGDPSVAHRAQGPFFPTRYRGPALILTSEVENISSAALEAAIRRRAPDIDFKAEPQAEPIKPGQRPTALGTYPEAIKAMQSGRMPLLCGVTYIPGFNVQGMDKESCVTSSWWWPETRAVVARTKAHAVTALFGVNEQTPPKERILIEMKLAAAALDVLKSATAVIWPDANAMWKPEDFRAQLDRANGEIPVGLAVAAKLGRDTENLHPDGTPKWFARTEGLHAFGMMEVEWRAFDGGFLELAAWIRSIAWYLINEGPVIRDGDTMGSDAPGVMPPLIIRHEPSTTVIGSRAYAVYPQGIS